MKQVTLVLTAVVCLAWSAPTVPAADKPIAAEKVLLRDPVDSTQRRFNLLSKDPSITFGSNGDSDTPSDHGAALLVFNPLSSECQCIVVPVNGWTIGGEGRRYVYRDTALVQGPVKQVVMKAGKLKIAARGSGLSGVTLDETQQGEIAVHYTSGTASRLCAHFPASTARVDQPGAFVAVDAPAPGACLPEPAACTPCVPPVLP